MIEKKQESSENMKSEQEIGINRCYELNEKQRSQENKKSSIDKKKRQENDESPEVDRKIKNTLLYFEYLLLNRTKNRV